MDLDVSGKVAIVTGASRGIGLAIARRLHAEGAKVAICGRDAGRLDQAEVSLKQQGRHVLACVADMTDADARLALVDRVLEQFGSVDILVNNAGTHVRGAFDDMTEAQLQGQLDAKLFGFLGMIRAVVPHMRKAGDGRIVNVIGQAARHPHPDRLPSGITNAAVQAMSKAVADGLARENIRVNAVCPQYVETDIITHTIEKEMRERGVDRTTALAGFTRANVLGRLGQPDEIADVVAFLVSGRSAYVTGSSVSVDGGYHRYVFG